MKLKDIDRGGRYNWRNQPERLLYIGARRYPDGYWHQFEKVGEPNKVWCEVRAADLESFVESEA